MGSHCTSEKWVGPGCGHYCENINRENKKTANPRKFLAIQYTFPDFGMLLTEAKRQAKLIITRVKGIAGSCVRRVAPARLHDTMRIHAN